MFQNLNNSEEDYTEINKTKKIKITDMFQEKNLFIYIIGFMISMVSFNHDFTPFGLAFLAACCSNRKPVGLVFILTLIGTIISFGIKSGGAFALSAIIFFGLVLIIRPNFSEEERNEKQKLGIYVFIASLVVQAGKMFFTGFLVYDLVASIAFGLISYIFYKIFSNSLIVLSEFGDKQVFSIEEVMGTCLCISIAFVSLSGLKLFGLSVTNILSVMLVLFLGWKHGMLIGATSGITIGMTLGIITATSPILVAAYAISGMIAGLLNKLGKIGVIMGFCIGNAILTYVTNGNTVPIITIREILVASLGLLIIPKETRINIEDIVPQVKCFPVTSGVLEGETAQRLNNVSETIADMAKSYDESAEDALSIDEENKEQFVDDLYNNLEDIEDNLFYDDLIDNENILYDIYNDLLEKNEISIKEIVGAIEKNTDSKIDINAEDIKNDIDDIVRLVNATYRIHKLNILWRVKEANNKKVLATQLRWSI